MFCPNCGTEIKDPGAFCPNCGTRLPQEAAITEESVVKERKKSGAGKVIVPAVVVAVALGGFFFVHQNKKLIDLNEFYTLTLSGYNGNGSAELTFDSEKFEEKYKDKLTLNEASVRKWAEKQQSEDYADMIVDFFQDRDPIEMTCDALENGFYTISQSEKLKNGQTLTFECSSQGLEDALEAAFGYEWKDLEDYKIEGLKEVAEYDPFKNLKVMFKGVNGEGTAEIRKPEDKISEQLEYEVDNDGKLSNGNVVKITLRNDINTLFQKEDVAITRTSEEIEVTGLAEPTPAVAPVASPTPMPTSAPAPAETGPALRSDFYKDGQITGTDPNYIVPDSMSRELTYSDIEKLSAKGLSFARNEMMARMGRGFKNQELADYFKSTSWYQETVSPEAFDAQGLPAVVETNASLMMNEELKLNGGELAVK